MKTSRNTMFLGLLIYATFPLVAISYSSTPADHQAITTEKLEPYEGGTTMCDFDQNSADLPVRYLHRDTPTGKQVSRTAW